MPYRIVHADSFRLVREGLRRILEGADVAIVGEATCLKELEEAVVQYTPQLVVAEIQLGGEDLTVAIPQLRSRYPQLGILIYSASRNPAHEARAFQAGASGYLDFGASRPTLWAAIAAVAEGKKLWTGADQRRLSSYLRSGGTIIGELAPLTVREEQVLRMVATGATNKEISEALAISQETVKEHVQHVLEKLSVVDRTQAAVWAVRHGHID